MRKDKNVTELLNNYFINITKNLNLKLSKNITVMISWSWYLSLIIM